MDIISMHSMAFHTGVSEIILFNGWAMSDWQGTVGSVVGIALMGAIYEAIKSYRDHLYISVQYSGQGKRKSRGEELSSGVHLLQTFLHMIQLLVSYFLMLIFMTYNVWLCFAIIIGCGLGYWMFSWGKSTCNNNECCH